MQDYVNAGADFTRPDLATGQTQGFQRYYPGQWVDIEWYQKMLP